MSMLSGVVVVVVAGIAGAILLGIGVGIDATGLVILASIVLVGALAIWTALKARARAVSPGVCPECGGLISPNAPHCKHCGATF